MEPPPTYVNKPQLVNIEFWNEKALGVAASTYYSVVWTGSTLYTCGFHGGQLGHPNSTDETFPSFKKVFRRVLYDFMFIVLDHLLKKCHPQVQCIYFQYTSITNVAVSDGAIVVVTDADDIFLLSDYKCRKICIRHIVKHVSIAETSLAGKVTTGNPAAKNLVW